MPFSWHQAERSAQPGQDEGELADLGQAGADRQRRIERVAEGEDEGYRGDGLAEHDDGGDGDHLGWLGDENLRVEQHADRDEEENRECVAQRQRFLGGAVAEFRAAYRHAGEERAEREGNPEQVGGTVGDADRGGDDAQGE